MVGALPFPFPAVSAGPWWVIVRSSLWCTATVGGGTLRIGTQSDQNVKEHSRTMPSRPGCKPQRASCFGPDSYRWTRIPNRYAALRETRPNSLLRWPQGRCNREEGEKDGLEEGSFTFNW